MVSKTLTALAAVFLLGSVAAANALTRFDLTFTGTSSTPLGSDASLGNGTGYVLVSGYTGTGAETFTSTDSWVPGATGSIVGFSFNLGVGTYQSFTSSFGGDALMTSGS